MNLISLNIFRWRKRQLGAAIPLINSVIFFSLKKALALKYSSLTGFSLCLLFSWVILAAGSTANAQTPVFDELKQQFESGMIFHAEFIHEYQDSYTGEESRTQGEIWIGKEHYRVESDEQVMIVDGELSRVFDPVRNRVLISDYIEEEDDFAPSRMLQGVDDTYEVQEDSESSETVITLTSSDPFAIFTVVEIQIDPQGIPKGIEAIDQVDNILFIRFENGEFIQQPQDLFQMDVPDDVEQIDLRH